MSFPEDQRPRVQELFALKHERMQNGKEAEDLRKRLPERLRREDPQEAAAQRGRAAHVYPGFGPFSDVGSGGRWISTPQFMSNGPTVRYSALYA